MASQDASNSYGFDGSFGEICGTTWYLSQGVIPGTNYMPKCMWIDANGDQPTTGFQYVFRAPLLLSFDVSFVPSQKVVSGVVVGVFFSIF